MATQNQISTLIPKGTTLSAALTAAATGYTAQTPTRAGYSFVKWNTKADGTGTDIAPTAVLNADTTVYAIWSGAGNVTLSYDINGGTGSVPSSQTVQSGTVVTVAFSPVPTKSGHIFAGWANSASATTPDYTAGSTVTMNTSKTLFAVYYQSVSIDITTTNAGLDVTATATSAVPVDTVVTFVYTLSGDTTQYDGTIIIEAGETFSSQRQSDVIGALISGSAVPTFTVRVV